MARGPVRVNTYDQRTTPRSQAQPFTHSVDVGNGLARGLDKVGQALQAEVAFKRQQEEDDARVYASTAMSQARASASEMQRRIFSEAPDGWRGATQRFSQEFGQRREQALSGAPTPAAQRYLNQQFDAYQPLLLEEMAGQEQTNRESWQFSTIANNIDSDSNTIATNPGFYQPALTQQLDLINGMAMSEANRERLRSHAISSYSTVAVSAMIERDPVQALQVLRGTTSNHPSADTLLPRLQALIPGATIFGSRTAERNAQLQGSAPNSRHIQDAAWDITLPAGVTAEQARPIVEQLLGGTPITEWIPNDPNASGDGTHLHVAWGDANAQTIEDDPNSPVARLTGAERLALSNQAEAEIARRQSNVASTVRSQIQTDTFLMSNGEQPVSGLTVEQVQAVDPELAAAYEIDLQTHQRGSSLTNLTTPELRRMASAAPLPSTASHQERLDNIVNRNAATQILEQRDDPMTYALRQARIDDTAEMTAAIDSGNFQDIGVRIRSRNGVAVEQSQRLGTVPAPLTTSEATRLRGILDRVPPGDRAQALMTLRQSSMMPQGRSARQTRAQYNMGSSQVYEAFVAQIYRDDPAALAGALTLARQGTVETNAGTVTADTVGRRLLAGAALLNPTAQVNAEGQAQPSRSTFNMPSEAALEGAFNTYVGDAYAEDPSGYRNAFQAYRAYYAGRASEMGINGAGLTFRDGALGGDRAAIETAGQAAEVIVGSLRPNEFGGPSTPGLPSQTYLPFGMTEDNFNRSLEQGWGSIRERYRGAQLSDNPSDYDYARDANGSYQVFYRGVPVRDDSGEFVRVRPRMTQR
jgi:hypothetical protein